MSKFLKINIIIHLFAIAHAITTLTCNYMSVRDDIPLTILTITMIIVIARTFHFPLDVTAALALLGCLAGFYLGIKGAEIIGNMLGGRIAEGSTDYVIAAEGAKFADGKLIPYANVITTALVTEIIGWTMYLIVRHNKQKTSE